MAAVSELSPVVGTQAACEALGLPRSSFYRQQRPIFGPSMKAVSARALSPMERDAVLACLHEERFQDRSPAAVYATLLDEGVYHCSLRTIYRILEEEGETGERRDQLTHPAYQKPELLATAPNQLWSWDITKLKGQAKWTYFYLYVILDVFSRYVVGWMVAPRETAELAKRLIADTCDKQNIQPGQLTIHADRGSSMTSKPVAFLLADLSVTKSHSRPYVSDDNPYSESHFRTLKYRPDFPERFGCIQDSRAFCHTFFTWYNEPRRPARMTHLCSVRVTHTKNTICPWARKMASDIIHAEGVRFAVPSSAPPARNLLSSRHALVQPISLPGVAARPVRL